MDKGKWTEGKVVLVGCPGSGFFMKLGWHIWFYFVLIVLAVYLSFHTYAVY